MTLMLTTPTSGKCTSAEAFAKNLIPGATSTYQPLSNEELILMIKKVAAIHKMKLSDEQLGMDIKGMRFFGVYTVEGFDFFGGRIKLMIGCCNSYNRSMSGRMCIGAEVTVCSNRCFYGFADDRTGVVGMATHEHRRNIHDGLFQRIDAAFAGIEQFRKKQELFYGHLNERQMTQEEAYHLIVRAAQNDVLNKTRVLTVAEEWDWQKRGPENKDEKANRIWHPEFEPRTAYSLFNAFSEVQKRSMSVNPVNTNLRSMDLASFFSDNYC